MYLISAVEVYWSRLVLFALRLAPLGRHALNLASLV